MATYTGSAGLVTVAGNTIAEIVGFSVDTQANTIEDSELTDSTATYKVGRTSWTGSVECHWDPTDTTGQNSMVSGNSMAFIFYFRGDSTGDPTIEGTAIVTGVSTNASDESMISHTYTLQGTGSLTYGTVA